MTNTVEYTQIIPSLEQIYMKHGTNSGLVRLLTSISIPVASEFPISWLMELKDLIRNKTMVYGSSGNVHTNQLFQIASIVMDEHARLLDFRDSPPVIEGARSNYFKSLSFIMLYRGDVDEAKKYFEMANRPNHNLEHLQQVLDRFDEAQRVLSESKSDLNQLRGDHNMESLDLFLLEHFDRYAERFKVINQK